MTGNRRQPDLAAGIASISPVVGCTSGCAYCYIELEKARHPTVNEYDLEHTITYLFNTPSFKSGRQGTILCFGGWGEMFPHTKSLREESINWITSLSSLGNPMVLFTKSSLTDEEIRRVYSCQVYERQLLLLVTITCLEKYREVEPNTDSPHERLSFVNRWVSAGLDAGILMNPFLRDYSLADYEQLLTELGSIRLDGMVISPLYLNDALMAKIRRSHAMSATYHRVELNGFKTSSHMGNKRFRVYADEMEDLYPALLQTARAYGLSVWKHYLCLVMNYFHQFNTDVFKKEACIDCGHCKNFLISDRT